jgi:hypothetical protein
MSRRPEHEWHGTVRARNAELREALERWRRDGDVRRLRRALVLVPAPPFAPPLSPRLRLETDRLLALAVKATLYRDPVPAPAVKETERLRAAALWVHA